MKIRNKISQNDLQAIANELINFEKLNVAVLGQVDKSMVEQIVKKELNKIR